MQRAGAVKKAGTWPASAARDRVTLAAEDRHRRRLMLVTEGGTQFLLDLPQPVALRHGDGLVLDDGSIIAVAGAPERLAEIEPGAHTSLVQLAWHLGNRHTEIEIVGNRLRIRSDHVLEAMVRGFGAKVRLVEAPFDPETANAGAPQNRGEI
jgi:urease accessory protein